jgi:hypothetical protein
MSRHEPGGLVAGGRWWLVAPACSPQPQRAAVSLRHQQGPVVADSYVQACTRSAIRPVATSSRSSAPNDSLASTTACQRRIRSASGME